MIVKIERLKVQLYMKSKQNDHNHGIRVVAKTFPALGPCEGIVGACEMLLGRVKHSGGV